MTYFSKTEFKKLSINDRYKALKRDGEHIAARLQGVHSIHLFSYHNFYVEVWIVMSLNQIHWIEVQENTSIINTYADQVDIKKDLGL